MCASEASRFDYQQLCRHQYRKDEPAADAAHIASYVGYPFSNPWILHLNHRASNHTALNRATKIPRLNRGRKSLKLKF
jgi:hypothetical protein